MQQTDIWALGEKVESMLIILGSPQKATTRSSCGDLRNEDRKQIHSQETLVKSSSTTKPPTPEPEDSPLTKLVIDEEKKIDDDNDEGHKTDASTTSKRALSPSSSNVDSGSDRDNTRMDTAVKHKKIICRSSLFWDKGQHAT